MKTKQLDLADRKDVEKKTNSNEIKKPVLWSACCPYRLAVDYVDDLPSMTRQEFAAECDVNNIMKNYEATGVMPSPVGHREPLYWDADSVPDNLQDAMAAMMYSQELFMQLPAITRKEFDNDPVRFVEFASDAANRPKLKEWGLTAPEIAPGAPVRVEVVTPPPQPRTPAPEPPAVS